MSTDGDRSEDTNNDPTQPPSWCLATAAHLEDLDFEAPIAGSNTADCGQLSEANEVAFRGSENAVDPLTTAPGRVFLMLHALTGMQPRPHDRNEPFGPFASMADGRRTAIPEDFRSAHIHLIGEMAERATNPVLRARLADVCWLLDRKRGAMGRAALLAYTEIVERVDGGELEFAFGKDEGVLHHTALSLLRRALFIGRSIGWDKPETVQARNIAVVLRKRAIAKRELFSAKSLSERDLDFDLSDPADVGHDLDDMIAVISADTNPDALVGLWRVAAAAYRLAKCDDEKNRCISEAASAWRLPLRTLYPSSSRRWWQRTG
jgi:hypothetical protein